MTQLNRYSPDSVASIRLIVPECLILITDDEERDQATKLYINYLLQLFDEATQSLDLVAKSSNAEKLLNNFAVNNPKVNLLDSEENARIMFDVYEDLGAEVDRQIGEISFTINGYLFFFKKRINCKLMKVDLSELQLKKFLLYPSSYTFLLYLSGILLQSAPALSSSWLIKLYGILNVVGTLTLAPQNKLPHKVMLARAKSLFQKTQAESASL